MTGLSGYMRLLILYPLLLWSIFLPSQTWKKIDGLFGGSTQQVKATSKVIMVTVRGRGLYYSADTGRTWKATPITKQVHALLADGDFVAVISSGTLFTSSDHCKTFVPRCPISDVGSSYLKDGKIYCSSYYGSTMSPDTGKTWFPYYHDFYTMLINGQHRYVAGSTFSVSHNGGKTYTDFTQLYDVRKIVADSNRVWALSNHTLFYSSDYGNTWITQLEDQSSFFANLLINNDTLYLSDGRYGPSVQYSADWGNSWKTLGDKGPVASRWFKDLCIFGNVFFKIGSGVHRSKDRVHWEQSDRGIRHADVFTLKAFDNLLIAEIWGESSRAQLRYSADNGDSWKTIKDLDSTFVGWQDYTFNDGVLFAADCHYGVYYSLDTGQTWKCVSGRTSFGVHGLHYKRGALHFSDHYMRDLLLTTRDFGATWDSTRAVEGNGWWTETASSETAVLHNSAFMFRSLNDGTTWEEVYTGTNNMRNLCFSGSYFFFSGGFHIYRGTPAGNVFYPVYEQWALNINKLDARGQEVLGASADTLYYSPNAGITWFRMMPPATTISAVAVNDHYLFIALQDQSIWRMNLRTAGLPTADDRSAPAHAYPNPVTSTANIIASGVRKGLFTLYDASGQLVRTEEVNGENFEFRRTDEQSGLYFFRISSATGSWQGKLLLD